MTRYQPHGYQPGTWMLFGSTPLSCDVCGMDEGHWYHLPVEEEEQDTPNPLFSDEINDAQDLDDFDKILSEGQA